MEDLTATAPNNNTSPPTVTATTTATATTRRYELVITAQTLTEIVTTRYVVAIPDGMELPYKNQPQIDKLYRGRELTEADRMSLEDAVTDCVFYYNGQALPIEILEEEVIDRDERYDDEWELVNSELRLLTAEEVEA
jgi:hypothetical protein